MKKIVLIGLLLCAIPLCSFSQVQCTNKLLAELIEQLPDIQLDGGFSGEKMVPDLCKSKPIIVQRDKKGVITHVGIKFFDRDIMAKHPSPVYTFIERYFLELLLLNEEEIATKLRMERVKISSEVYSLQSLKKGLNDMIGAVSHHYSVYVTCNNNRYSASCMNDDKVVAKIEFPVSYQLMTGYSKLEAENSVYPSLLVHSPGSYTSPSAVDMSVYKDSLYCANVDYYAMEDIISTSYYKKEGERFVPLYSMDYLTESVYNLFNSRYDWKVEVEMTQSLYGGKNLSYTVPLTKLTDWFRSKKCSLYTGIKKYDKNVIEGVLMVANMELGYQHILTFSFDKKMIEKPTDYKVKVKMYSYVPIHNLSSLY